MLSEENRRAPHNGPYGNSGGGGDAGSAGMVLSRPAPANVSQSKYLSIFGLFQPQHLHPLP
jgi:hypothetical protein